MPGTNLTREEAQTRAGLLSVASYTVDLDLTVSDKVFESTTVLKFTCSEPGASTFADLVGATIHEVWLNGNKLDEFDVYRDSRIRLDNLQAVNELRVHCELPYSHTGEGLHRFVDPADGKVYLYSQFEVPDARRVFTTFEQPDLKSRFTFTVTAPSLSKATSTCTPPLNVMSPVAVLWNRPPANSRESPGGCPKVMDAEFSQSPPEEMFHPMAVTVVVPLVKKVRRRVPPDMVRAAEDSRVVVPVPCMVPPDQVKVEVTEMSPVPLRIPPSSFRTGTVTSVFSVAVSAPTRMVPTDTVPSNVDAPCSAYRIPAPVTDEDASNS